MYICTLVIYGLDSNKMYETVTQTLQSFVESFNSNVR